MYDLTSYVIRFSSAIILIKVVTSHYGLGMNVSLQLVALLRETAGAVLAQAAHLLSVQGSGKSSGNWSDHICNQD